MCGNWADGINRQFWRGASSCPSIKRSAATKRPEMKQHPVHQCQWGGDRKITKNKGWGCSTVVCSAPPAPAQNNAHQLMVHTVVHLLLLNYSNYWLEGRRSWCTFKPFKLHICFHGESLQFWSGRHMSVSHNALQRAKFHKEPALTQAEAH